MRGPNIFVSIVGALWMVLLWEGWNGIRDISEQHAVGYPNSAQIYYYMGTSLAVIAALATFAVLLNWVWRFPTVLAVIGTVAMLGFVPYLLGYTGGV